MVKLGRGVLTWCGAERRSGRYGAIVLVDEPFEGGKVCQSSTDREALWKLRNERVRMKAVVVETRKSGHIGDQFLDIEPTTPDVGEEIDLGVGKLSVGKVDWDPAPTIILRPGDGRKVNWYDPRKLYRLHDQTVDLFAEVTEDDFTEAPDIHAAEDGVMSTGEEDGSFQTRGMAEEGSFRIHPGFERIGEPGDGLFAADWTPRKGKRYIVNED
jgi:hypothetical protein